MKKPKTVYEEINGKHVWTQNGIVHRGDGPAIIERDGTQEWWIKGSLHRDNDLPAMISRDGSMSWFKHGERHRDNGPATIIPGQRELYFRRGLMHRSNGPAVMFANGQTEWWVMGERIRDKREYQRKTGNSDMKLSLLILKYGEIK